ncbi:MAG: hypothetical protein LBC77_01560 [Spirochaetaceae bacterium]|jgi:hypothetical protein|nr:hypothetical protein [Spirochaetaceae bacterium]
MRIVPRSSIFCFVLSAFLVFTAFYARSFIASELHHEHDREGRGNRCSVCDKIELAILFLEGFGRAFVIAAVMRAMLHAEIPVKIRPPLAFSMISLITLKVRINP